MTIETQYAGHSYEVTVWRCPPSTFLFLQKDIEPFDGAEEAPDDLRRPGGVTTVRALVVCMSRLRFMDVQQRDGPVAQLVRAHA